MLIRSLKFVCTVGSCQCCPRGVGFRVSRIMDYRNDKRTLSVTLCRCGITPPPVRRLDRLPHCRTISRAAGVGRGSASADLARGIVGSNPGIHSGWECVRLRPESQKPRTIGGVSDHSSLKSPARCATPGTATLNTCPGPGRAAFLRPEEEKDFRLSVFVNLRDEDRPPPCSRSRFLVGRNRIGALK